MTNAYLIFGTLVLLVVVFNIWAVTDIAKYSYKIGRKKWLWTNIVLFLPFLGVFFYLFNGKRILNKEIHFLNKLSRI